MSDLIGSLIRKALVFAGAWLISKGWVTDAQWLDIATALAGLILSIAPVVWSLIRRWLEAKRKATVVEVPKLDVQRVPMK